MTALVKFIITSILGLIGFATPGESEMLREDALYEKELIGSTLIKPLKNCDSILKNSCFLLK